MKRKNNQGFTLIELSIVLVIISLIVGGVIGGKSLVSSARVSSMIAEVKSYHVVYNSFLTQYDALPGDFREAADYWSTCVDSAYNTCNGNGNGVIDYTPTAGRDAGESIRVWQHLSLAELLPIQYMGSANAIGSAYVAGVHMPKITLPSGQDGVIAVTHETSGPYIGIAVRTGHIFQVGMQYGNNAINPGAIHGTEGKKIDKKIDDGNARNGKLTGEDAAARWRGCVDASDQWVLSATENVCFLRFWW